MNIVLLTVLSSYSTDPAVSHLRNLRYQNQVVVEALAWLPDIAECNKQITTATKHKKDFEKLRWLFPGDKQAEFKLYMQQMDDWIVEWRSINYLRTNYSDNEYSIAWNYSIVERLRTRVGETNWRRHHIPPPYSPRLLKLTERPKKPKPSDDKLSNIARVVDMIKLK